MFSPVFCHLNTKAGQIRQALDKGFWITFGLFTNDGRIRVLQIDG